MDPASVIGIIGVVGQIIKAIYQYSDGVAESRTEVARLRAELFGMQAALKQVEWDLQSSGAGSGTLASPNLHSEESYQVLEEARNLLLPLAKALDEGITRSSRLAKRLFWPLKRQHVQDIANHLERLKTYFILAATNDSLQATREALQSLRKLHLSIEDAKANEDRKTAELEVHKWLDAYDSNPTHNTALSAHMEGTGSWFIDGIISNWMLRSSRLLWLTGQSGSGKTCLMAASANRVIEAWPNIFGAYFYCSSNHISSQSPRAIFASLVSQLLDREPTARDHIISFYRERLATSRGQPQALDTNGLVHLIQQACAVTPKMIVLFVDAVNECEENSFTTLRTLLHLAGRIGKAKLLISSTESVAGLRPHGIFPVNFDIWQVEMQGKDVTHDIDRYIEVRFEKATRLKKLRQPLQDLVKQELRSKNHGSFRWVQCTIDDLARLATPKAMKEALKGITPSLSDNYKATLAAVPIDILSIAQPMLLILVSSHVSEMRLEELAEAAIFSSADAFCEDDRLIEPEFIIRHLRNLVRYDPLSSVVQLAHSSVRDFLTSRELSGEYYIDPVAAKVIMARVCVEYLTNSAFACLCCDDEALTQRKRNWPLFEYASFYWTRYIRTLDPLPDNVWYPAIKLMGSADLGDENNWASWYQCIYPEGDEVVWSTRPLYMCAREGLTILLRELLTTCDLSELGQRGGVRGSTPINIAATYGRTRCVELLLAAGADPNEQNDEGDVAIQWAALMGHEEIVKALLEGGADPTWLEQPVVFDTVVQYQT